MAVGTLSVTREFEVARRILCNCLVSSPLGDLPLPGQTYLGMWGRDSAFMALGLHQLGLREQAAYVLKRWTKFVFDERTDPSLVCIRHKGAPDWTRGLKEFASAEWVRERYGAFPTNVYIGHEDFPPGAMEVYGGEPDIDSTALWIYAACEICIAERDPDLAREMLPVLASALAYLRSRQRPDGLIEQGPNEDWADTLRRFGVVAYTQVTLYSALDAASRLYESLGWGEQSRRAKHDARLVRRSMRDALMEPDGAYRVADASSKPGGVCQDLALLVVTGAACDPAPVLRSLDALATPYGHRIVEEPYPPDGLGPDVYPWGQYHNGGIWPWWLGVEALARARAGDREGAAVLIHHAVTDGTVYEWRDANTGEGVHPEFVTGAAALVWACLAGGLV